MKIATVKAAMVTYGEQRKTVEQKYKKDLQWATQNYRGDMFQKRLQELEAERAAGITALNDECRSMVNAAFTNAHKALRDAVIKPMTDDEIRQLETLKLLGDAVSAEEAKQFLDPDHSYAIRVAVADLVERISGSKVEMTRYDDILTDLDWVEKRVRNWMGSGFRTDTYDFRLLTHNYDNNVIDLCDAAIEAFVNDGSN